MDEVLLRSLEGVPTLRLYQWQGDWVSLGYFGELSSVEDCFDGSVSVVRRWTGGGVVDHRKDFTYSLMIPRDDEVAKMRGAESYAAIHAVVVEALCACGVQTELIAKDGESDSPQCFEKPVAWDVVDVKGRKLAGAGQRRTRWGLLHQGSVLLGEGREEFGKLLVEALSGDLVVWSPSGEVEEKAEKLAVEKYAVLQR